MEKLIQKLDVEKQELDIKINKLWSYVESDKFKTLDTIHQYLLIDQHKIMKSYSSTLEKRIQHIKNKC